MGVKEQLIKLKENWLLLVLIVLVIGFLNFGSSISFNKGLSSVDYLESRSMSPMVGTSYYLKDSSGAMRQSKEILRTWNQSLSPLSYQLILTF